VAAALGTRSTGWGASWADLDLDGDLDVAIATGHIPVTNLRRDAQRVVVLENVPQRSGTSFVDVGGRAVTAPQVNGRGLAVADFDNDGDPDVAVNSISGRLILLRNTGASGHWLEVQLGRFAPGTRITAVLPDGTRLVRWVTAGSSYLSSEDPRLHFGLGRARRVRSLEVRFPDGTVRRLGAVAANRLVTVSDVGG
jgi:hypothetical protein